MNALGSISNENQKKRKQSLMLAFISATYFCCSFVDCHDMQSCAQGKAEGRCTARSWQYWMKKACRFTCGFCKVTGKYKGVFLALSNTSDGNFFQK